MSPEEFDKRFDRSGRVPNGEDQRLSDRGVRFDHRVYRALSELRDGIGPDDHARIRLF